MIYKNEKSLINIIKYAPIIFIITLSLIITLFLYVDKQNELEKEKIAIQNEFLKKNQEFVKTEIENLYNLILKTQAKTEEKLKQSIKERVYEANNIATRIYNENKDTKSKEEIIKMIKDAIVDIRFNDGQGYIFIYSFDYECILLPINRANEGKSFYNFQDSNGFYLGREIVKSLQGKDEAFLTWRFPKPDDLNKQDFKKIGFNVHFKPYDWFIGSGEYVVDFEENMKKELLEYISNLKSSENNYFFILDYDKKTLFQKVDNIVDKSFQEFQTKEENKLFDDIFNLSKNGGGFISYDDKITDSEIPLRKTSYVKGLFSWKWIIGKGFYDDYLNQIIEKKSLELNQKFNEKIKNILLIASVLTLILLFISIYISKLLEKKFQNYKFEINNQEHILSQQSKMAAMGEMLGNIAHQWRQPLSVITTVATGMKLQKEFNTLDDETFEKSIQNITNSALYLSETIDDFRNFFKTDKYKTTFNIKNTFEKLFKLTSAQFKNLEITFVNEINDYELYNYENELIQALINILNNAKDALENINTPKVIFISTKKKEDKVIIKITDNAGGIDEKIIDKVCEPYFTTKHQAKGTGIGLFMTEEIIVKHLEGNFSIKNVNIDYENKNYKGAEITIEIDSLKYE
ncbi:MAG: cache domain-containing protein [Aliarcobacter sp.]|jgi:signal transduction histidine kinase|nr:cache domain-containing protein [Aliarcobacter sp.]